MSSIVETWGVTPDSLKGYIGTSTAALTDETASQLSTHINAAASTANVYVDQLAGVSPASVATNIASEQAVNLSEFVREYIRRMAAAAWLRFRSPERSQELEEDCAARLKDLRYRLPAARSALAPQVGPPRTDGRATAPPSWLDGGRGEEFG